MVTYWPYHDITCLQGKAKAQLTCIIRHSSVSVKVKDVLEIIQNAAQFVTLRQTPHLLYTLYTRSAFDLRTFHAVGKPIYFHFYCPRLDEVCSRCHFNYCHCCCNNVHIWVVTVGSNRKARSKCTKLLISRHRFELELSGKNQSDHSNMDYVYCCHHCCHGCCCCCCCCCCS